MLEAANYAFARRERRLATKYSAHAPVGRQQTHTRNPSQSSSRQSSSKRNIAQSSSKRTSWASTASTEYNPNTSDSFLERSNSRPPDNLKESANTFKSNHSHQPKRISEESTSNKQEKLNSTERSSKTSIIVHVASAVVGGGYEDVHIIVKSVGSRSALCVHSGSSTFYLFVFWDYYCALLLLT